MKKREDIKFANDAGDAPCPGINTNLGNCVECIFLSILFN